MRWALVISGAVYTVVDQATQPDVVIGGGSWVDVTGLMVGPGYAYNGSTFTAPAVARSLTPKQFWSRFTTAERELLENKAATGTQTVKDKLAAFKTYVMTGMSVELGDDYIIASLTQMESAGVLVAGRAAQILA